mgnify:CR=1 FL=1
MSESRLTQSEKQLLERYYDDALSKDARQRAEVLLAGSEVAREYVSSLKELTYAAGQAEEQLWEDARAQGLWSADAVILETDPGQASLFELESMLLRYHDDEVTEEEAAEVEQLRAAREDVADYLGGLSELGLGVSAATAEVTDAVDFGAFWSGLEGRLDELDGDGGAEVVEFPRATKERPAFDLGDHQVLLYRYHDDEVTEEERAQVEAWAEIDDSVASTLAALSELRFATQASMELAEEHIEPGLLWSRISEHLGEEESSNVRDFAHYKESKEQASEHVEVVTSHGHRREIFIALAAMLCTVFGVALFKDSLFPGEKVIVEKTVVIVDSLEYGDGTSVMVTGPMQSASMEVVTDSNAPAVEKGDDVQSEDEEATPTVIWLIDPEQDVEPAQEPVNEDEVKDVEPKGQPI